MLANNMYKVLGKMMSTMVMQEGPPLNIFTPALAHYIIFGTYEDLQPEPSECTDGHVRIGLKKVSL